MDGHHHHGRGHDLPPLSSAAVVLPQPPLGYSPTLLFSNNPSHDYRFPHSSSFLFKDEGRRALDAWNTKLARTKRKLARQRTLGLTKSSSSSSSSCGVFGCSSSSNDDHSKQTTITHYPNSDSRSKTTQNLFTFCTPDNKILRILLKKELKNSDVGSLGRIVLPKREAEENLPLLTDKEGVQIVIRDVNSNRKWTMKYKYWANNRSRMYVLENTGDFVKQNGLLMGDVMTLYQDECKNLYVSVEKEENESSMEDNYEMRNYGQVGQSGTTVPAYTNMDLKHQQQDQNQQQHPSLALFIEPPLCFNNNNNNNNLVLSQNADSYYERYWSNSACNYMMNNNNNINNGKAVLDQDLHAAINDFEDCFADLDTLPEVSGLFKFHQIT